MVFFICLYFIDFVLVPLLLAFASTSAISGIRALGWKFNEQVFIKHIT